MLKINEQLDALFILRMQKAAMPSIAHIYKIIDN